MFNLAALAVLLAITRLGGQPELPRGPEFRRRQSDAQNISIASNHLVHDGVDEETEEEARYEAGDDHNSERLLGIGADAGGHGRRQQAKTGHESRHHNGAQSQQRRLAGGGANIHVLLETQLVDVGDEDDGRFNGYADQREHAKSG